VNEFTLNQHTRHGSLRRGSDALNYGEKRNIIGLGRLGLAFRLIQKSATWASARSQVAPEMDSDHVKSSIMDKRTLRDFVFIHINKTGGSSIEAALHIPFEHKTALERIRELGVEAWKRRFTFAFVRNPWDRAVSHYHYRVETNQTALATRQVGFAEWVKRCYGERDPFYYDQPKMFMPQLRWIRDDQERVCVDFVGRFESIQPDFEHICKRLNRRSVLPHLKRSSHRSYREYYDTKTLLTISDWFAEDIEYFGYEF
jgi:chondroitin 4-sulfotransferase 11